MADAFAGVTSMEVVDLRHYYEIIRAMFLTAKSRVCSTWWDALEPGDRVLDVANGR